MRENSVSVRLCIRKFDWNDTENIYSRVTKRIANAQSGIIIKNVKVTFSSGMPSGSIHRVPLHQKYA
jgi:hypothetical protein